MTQTPVSAPASAAEPSWTPRRVLRAVAVVSCIPYLGLKVAWIAGSRLGIPEGSPLLEHRTTMAVANSLTVVMDGTVIVLALLLTRPWGLRVPSWVLIVPMWVATGLLAPIMAGFPLHLVATVLGGNGGRTTGKEPFLDAWVFGVVYTGFIVQGLTLGTLFVLYARDRWGHLWREWPAGRGHTWQRVITVAAAVTALFPAAMHLLWAFGATAGLNDARVEDRASDSSILETMYVVFLAAAVTGAYLLAFRRPGRTLPVKTPLALAWVGSGAVACWGGWLWLASLADVDDLAERPTALMNLTHTGQMIVGLLVVTVGVSFFAERSRAAERPA